MSTLLLLLLAVGPSPSQPLDATATQRGMVSTGPQTFAGQKTFVDGGIIADLKVGSFLMSIPICSTAPGGPGAVLTFTDAGVWCPVGGYASFELAPSNGVGLTSSCACSAISAATPGASISFARSTSAWCTKDDYTLVSCPANTPRVMTGTGGTSPKGIFLEDPATNSLLWSRDLSQVNWVKTSMTCALTATGADGVANSASTCTSTAINGTALQTVTTVAATRNGSMYIKRISGTGQVFVTHDGAHFTDISSQLTANYKRVVPAETVGCAYGNCIVVPGTFPFDGTSSDGMVGTTANPVVGFKLAASGDSVVVDLAQEEVGYVATSPITTTGTSTPRGYDTLTVTVPSNVFTTLAYSLVATNYINPSGATGVDTRPGSPWFIANIDAQTYTNAANIYCNANGSSSSVPVYAAPLGPSPWRCVLTPGATLDSYSLGAQYRASGAFVAPAAVTTLTIGGEATAYSVGGVISQVCAGVNGGDCANRPAHPTSIAMVGDSIYAGTGSTTYAPPFYLRNALLLHRTVYNLGLGGDSIAATCLKRAIGAIASKVGTIVFECGTNDFAGGATAAATWAALQPVLDSARAAGIKVIPQTVLPSSQMNAPKEAERVAFNASLLAWCSSTGSTCVNAESMGTGANPNRLQAGYDSGDGVHPNAAGATALAVLIKAANP